MTKLKVWKEEILKLEPLIVDMGRIFGASQINWELIGGTAVFEQMKKHYGDKAIEIWKKNNRDTDDIDVIASHFAAIDLLRNAFDSYVEVVKSPIFKNKYTVKVEKNNTKFDIYIITGKKTGQKIESLTNADEGIFELSDKYENDGNAIYMASLPLLLVMKMDVHSKKKKIDGYFYEIPRERDLKDIFYIFDMARMDKNNLEKYFKNGKIPIDPDEFDCFKLYKKAFEESRKHKNPLEYFENYFK